MDGATWAKMAQAIEQAQQRPRPRHTDRGLEPETERVFLAQLDQLVQKAPDLLKQIFRNIAEKKLEPAIKRQLDLLTGGSFSWKPTDTPSPDKWFLSAISQIRALDVHLAQGLSEGLRLRPDPRHWEVREHGAYVIPRRHRGLDDNPPKAGEPYSRRGVLHHCILPFEVSGLRVRPVQLPPGPGATCPGRSRLRLGAALFQGGELDTRLVQGTTLQPKRFVADTFRCLDKDAELLQQIAAAFQDRCFAAVWPELTIAPESRAFLSEQLALRALELGPNFPLCLIVAGSWHVCDPVNDGEQPIWVNEAPVFDRQGRLLLRYRKIKPYFDVKEEGEEGIASGTELPVLVAGGLVIGFAICMDFCDLAADHPFERLPVDLLLIPSMGNRATLEGHANNAKRQFVRTNTTVFVVQQVLQGKGTEAGYVLHSGSAAAGRGRAQSKGWQTYRGRARR